MDKFKIWSCKLKRPDTLKSHRTLEAAAKKVGDHGFVNDPSVDAVYQVIAMVNNTFLFIDTKKNASRCNTGGFDMLAAMDSFGIERPGSSNQTGTEKSNDSTEGDKLMMTTGFTHRTGLDAKNDVNQNDSIENAALFLRQSVSGAELAGKIDECKALAFIEQLREIERVLTKHR